MSRERERILLELSLEQRKGSNVDHHWKSVSHDSTRSRLSVRKATVRKATVRKATVRKATVRKTTYSIARSRLSVRKATRIVERVSLDITGSRLSVRKATVRKATVRKATVRKATQRRATQRSREKGAGGLVLEDVELRVDLVDEARRVAAALRHLGGELQLERRGLEEALGAAQQELDELVPLGLVGARGHRRAQLGARQPHHARVLRHGVGRGERARLEALGQVAREARRVRLSQVRPDPVQQVLAWGETACARRSRAEPTFSEPSQRASFAQRQPFAQRPSFPGRALFAEGDAAAVGGRAGDGEGEGGEQRQGGALAAERCSLHSAASSTAAVAEVVARGRGANGTGAGAVGLLAAAEGEGGVASRVAGHAPPRVTHTAPGGGRSPLRRCMCVACRWARTSELTFCVCMCECGVRPCACVCVSPVSTLHCEYWGVCCKGTYSTCVCVCVCVCIREVGKQGGSGRGREGVGERVYTYSPWPEHCGLVVGENGGCRIYWRWRCRAAAGGWRGPMKEKAHPFAARAPSPRKAPPVMGWGRRAWAWCTARSTVVLSHPIPGRNIAGSWLLVDELGFLTTRYLPPEGHLSSREKLKAPVWSPDMFCCVVHMSVSNGGRKDGTLSGHCSDALSHLRLSSVVGRYPTVRARGVPPDLLFSAPRRAAPLPGAPKGKVAGKVAAALTRRCAAARAGCGAAFAGSGLRAREHTRLFPLRLGRNGGRRVMSQEGPDSRADLPLASEVFPNWVSPTKARSNLAACMIVKRRKKDRARSMARF
ncbi:Protein of unknown function [Gryllus bimaculatus]|nr:Protein of unknown function [Gryllus bimaculatus]